MIEDDKGIKDLEVRYFKQIFRDDNQTNIEAQPKAIHLFPSFLHQEEMETFTCQISLEEVELALKYFNKDKSPSRDGWPLEFFLGFFDLLGNEIVNVVETFRLEGRFIPSLNSTFIALIPKK